MADFKVRTYLSIFVGILCFIQLCLVTKEFLSFNVITKVSLAKSKIVQLPSVTLCEPLYYFFTYEFYRKNEALFHQYKMAANSEKEFYNITNMKIGGRFYFKLFQLLRNLRVSTLQQIVGTGMSVLNVHWLLNFKTGKLKPADQSAFESKQFFRNNFVCQTLSPKNSSDFNYNLDFLSAAQQSDILATYRVTLKDDKGGRILVALTPAGQIPLAPATLFRWLPREKKGLGYILIYKVLETNLIGPPYKSNCFTYKSGGGQLETYHECLNNLTSRMFNCTAPGAAVMWDSYQDAIFEGGYIKYKENYVPALEQILASCGQINDRPDCKSTLYTITEIKDYDYDKDIYFDIYTPHEPTLSTQYFPAMSVLEYVIQMGSTLGYWLGFSVFSGMISTCKYLKLLGDFWKQKQRHPQSKRRVTTARIFSNGIHVDMPNVTP